MDSAATRNSIQYGFWTEHSSNTWYILVTEEWSSYINVVVALALWLSLLRSYEIPRRLAIFACEKVLGGTRVPDQDIMMQDLPIVSTVAAITAQVLSDVKAPEAVLSRTFEEFVLIDPLRPTVAGTFQRSSLRRKWRGAFTILEKHPLKTVAVIAPGILVFCLAFGYQMIAVFTNRIVDHEIGRSDHPQTGAWFPDILDAVHMVNTSIFPVVNEFQTNLIFKAIAYAENCYIENARDEECSLFYTPKFEYAEFHNASCPFAKHMCSGKPDTAYDLDTGWKDAKALGINQRHTVQFRARKVCSPLNLDGYLRSEVVHESGTRYVEYLLGDGWGIIHQGNKTFGELVRDPLQFHTEPAQYLFREVKEDAIMNQKSPRQLIPELQVPGSRVTLFFVRPVNVAYTRPSSDPIFPATQSSGPGMMNGDPLYVNPLQHSTVFACADSFTLRHPEHHIEWQPRYQNLTALQDPRWKQPDVLTSLHILNITHLAPSDFLSRYADMSNHFNAPRRIGTFYSAPLDKEQWKLEAKKIFNTDLALLQYHNLGIAQGLGHDLPHARNLLDDFGIDARGQIIFPALGSKNIKVSALVGFLSACLACWVFTWKISDGIQQQNTLVITWLLFWTWQELEVLLVFLTEVWTKLCEPGFYGELVRVLDDGIRWLKAYLR